VKQSRLRSRTEPEDYPVIDPPLCRAAEISLIQAALFRYLRQRSSAIAQVKRLDVSRFTSDDLANLLLRHGSARDHVKQTLQKLIIHGLRLTIHRLPRRFGYIAGSV
jgi:hypothetical protein